MVCYTYTSPAGMVYTSSAVFSDTLTNSIGCDSIITVNLTVNNSTSSSISPIACGSYTSPNGMIYTSSAVFNDTLTNSTGCDSIIMVNLTINNSTTNSISPVVCDTYTSPSGMIYTNSAVFNDTIPNGNGCDSILTINLTVNNVDTSITLNGTTLVSNATNATYQWINCDINNAPIFGMTNQTFTPSVNGRYAVIVTQNGCTSTSNCINVVVSDIHTINTIETVKIYPNPSAGLVTVEFLDNSVIENNIKVFNSLGQIVWTANSDTSPTIQLDLSTLTNGVYLLQVNDQFTTKLILRD